VCLITSPPQAVVVSWEFPHNQEGNFMSVISDDFYHLIQNKIAELHDVAMQGYVKEPEYTQVQNRAALIFCLEAILDAHRQKFATQWSPLLGKSALHHLLIQKYKWPLSEIRALSLQDSIFLLQEELNPANIPEAAMKMVEYFNAHHAKQVFPEIIEEEWDPDLYQLIPKQRGW
jgi:hypothetical protein